MAKKNNINNSALSRLCSYIAIASQQGQLINDTLQAQDKVFSSKHVTDLINSMSEQDKKYVDDIVANLNKLSSKTTNVIPDSSNAEPNTLYLYSADPNPTSYNQYMVLSDKTILDLGTTNISLDGYLKETDADSKYLKQVDSHTHSNKSTIDNLTQNVIDNINNLNIEVDGVSYTQDVDGKIALPNYPVPRTNDEIKTLADGQINAKMTTTIDSTSTDTQIPSAKAIYNMSGVKYFTEEEINSYGNSTFLSGIVNKTIAATVIPNAVDYYYLIKLPWDSQFNSQIWISACGRQDAYIRHTKIEGVWDTPKKICTTKVADVATTVTTFENADVSGYVKYYVKNGICHVTFWPVQSTSTGTGKKLLSNMPIPLGDDTGTALFHANGDGTSTAFSYVNSSGNLYAHFYKVNTASFGTFSYPVKES